MGYLSVGNLEKSFGTQTVLSGISFEIQESDRVGLIGSNGSGKTTLFKLIAGELAADSGTISMAGKTTLGYMEQHVCRDLDRNALDEVLTVFSPLIAQEQELESIGKTLRGGCIKNIDALIERQTALNDRFIADGGLTFRSRAHSALLGLGFTESQISVPVGNLSGGQRAKLQLAKLLLSGANLMLLDEPTNHLDLASVEWLEEFLRSSKAAFLVISHDRFFLDRVTNRTFELKHHRLRLYKGSYTAYVEQKGLNDLSVTRAYENTKKEIGRLEGIVEQQRRWNREKNIKTAESKQKMIDRLEQTLVKPDALENTLHFHFGTDVRSGNDVLTAKGLELSFGTNHLFQNVALEIHRGDRTFLIGSNGCGKTSLFKVLLGQIPPDHGFCRIGTGVKIGYYDQLQTGLSPEKRVIDEIWDYYPRLTETQVRSALAVFLFQEDDVFKQVSALSGGERARILLLRLMLSRDNFLLLDEPTNHLDLPSCEALEDALQDYDGTLFIISHDRYFINKTASRIYALKPDGLADCGTNYSEYLEQLKAEQSTSQTTAVHVENDYKKRKKQESALRKQKSAIRRLEQQLDQNEQEISTLQEELSEPEISSDYQAAMEITEKIDALNNENETLFEKWEELSQSAEEA
ncbi:MAG: ABC-F family ATP-binding cassette domain-containing protein [Oscillospiraceae bacterium]|jgi:ATP-binding cassette subfamily F protein 3|nr:ABC-F family ATP-binding cassette domain-containing protein [Oscillospiraceae bacterium]